MCCFLDNGLPHLKLLVDECQKLPYSFEQLNRKDETRTMTKTTWTHADIAALFEKPFHDLLHLAHRTHRAHNAPNQIQLSTLLNIKTGRCPEDCSYCTQSAHFKTNLQKEDLFDIALVVSHAKSAKAKGATRFCMGAAWRSPPKEDFPKVLEMIKAIKALGLETCVTLGMLTDAQTQALKTAGLDYYNHNLDTSEAYYPHIVSTRRYQDRLDTLRRVCAQGINVCCGGILGMGETREDRIDLLHTLTTLPKAPESIPINQLVPMPGTPLENATPVDAFEFIRTIAVARVMFPTSAIRLSAGRTTMHETEQALCFHAGANSIHFGEKLLTTPNPEEDADMRLIKKLGMTTHTTANA